MTSMSTPPQSPVRTTTSSSTSASSSSSTSSMILLSPVGRFAARRRALEVDGRPLQHWDRQNFEPRRDETCRVVYEPKQGAKFFQQHLQQDDYQIMRRHSLLLEQPYFSKYVRYFPKRGYFACKACGNPLYGHASKFDAEDGWPAFGTCIEGSVGIQTNEERQKQIHEEHAACTKLQALVRGALCRIKVTRMLDELIEDLLKQRAAQVVVPAGGDGGTTAGGNSIVVGNGQQEVTTTTAAETAGGNQTTTKKGKYTGRYTWVQELGEDYLELHCHRCKCHLGDIVEEENDGRQQHGQTFNEHHRVNGRALKYVEDDLPRRVRTDCSLLFANETQRRLLGLPDRSKMLGGSSSSTHSNTNPSFPLRTTPFISPRTRRRTLSNDRSTAGVSFQSPRKDEKWSTTKTSIAFGVGGGGGSKLRGGGVTGRRFPTNSSSLSVSCHARPMQVPFLNHDDDADDDDDYSYDDLNDESFSSTSSFNNGSSHHSNSILSGSMHSTGTASTIHSKPRRKKKTSINVRERKAALEDFMLSRSMH